MIVKHLPADTVASDATFTVLDPMVSRLTLVLLLGYRLATCHRWSVEV